MSLFRNPSVSPSRLRGVYRFLLRAPEQREERERLGRIFMPEPMLGDRGRATFDKTILEGCEMGLFEEVTETVGADGRGEMEEQQHTYVALHPDLPEKARDTERGEAVLADVVCKLILEQEERNDEFAHAVAWLLAQDPLEATGDWDSVRRAINRSGCRGVTGLTNDTPYRQVKYWMMFFGLAWEDGLGDQIVPDPTELLRRNLKLLFQEPEESRPLPSVLRRLAEHFPVFEGGRYRNRIEELSGQRESQHLSTATAQAFLRLENEGAIALESPSDDRLSSRIFPGSDRNKSFSYVRWTP